MKRILLSAALLMIPVLSQAEIVHCIDSYKGKPFYLVQLIAASGSSFGQPECVYQENKNDKHFFKYIYDKNNIYYPVSSNWQDAFPGILWCGIDVGGSFDNCTFAKKEKSGHQLK